MTHPVWEEAYSLITVWTGSSCDAFVYQRRELLKHSYQETKAHHQSNYEIYDRLNIDFQLRLICAWKYVPTIEIDFC
ncbi:Hypothetical predicted protein [Octopus vulgaris]|uniref:Uncharacterized protein n=1 Tax=Octopus vulgaris TaxID=6645 RepID=A0AA36BZD8_OCTVU|nr:Hypothetical predicted protein [Octopus vulgaris]